jgi:hypothetical protein
MARSDLLISLVRAGVSGDRGTFAKTVNAIVAEERAKQHNVVADTLEKVVTSTPMSATSPARFAGGGPDISVRAKDFLAEKVPQRKISDLVLPDLVLCSIGQLVEEQQRASLLRSHSLEPRHRVLLVGPPGNGKTTLAEGVAESLAIPFFVVRYEALIGSFLGETASRLKRVFDYVCTIPCVLFFDEFDAVGKERGDKHETGEIKRVVTSLLMQIDTLPSYVVVMAATNHSELLDRAVWRRFQLRLSLPAPNLNQISDYLSLLSSRTKLNLGLPINQIAKSLGHVSYSEAEEFFLDAARRQVLSAGERSARDIIKEQIKLWQARAQDSAGALRGKRERGGTSSP